ncbi:MAG: carbohydrate ABC transporter permease [Ilumatobacter sp.]|uniref:carbohydrate ABC transporter permease n=1 Tax=Ilumatobacter sp. TaxID=1967498 RepID=UPI00261DFD69|nr:carbohydrate ABC transporter permease [Ilumatobacter sp.]MDJ0769794.1 carbohydrate ABC transporter permease [Ilumatobacter sp.]
MSVLTSERRDVDALPDMVGGNGIVDRIYKVLRGIPTAALWLIVLVWSLPTIGLFVNSWRNRDAQRATGWWDFRPDDLTLDNYDEIFTASASTSLGDSLLNSMAIAVPATIIPIAVAAFAAYGFAWIDFKGRKGLFIATVSLLAIPLQVALIPLLQMYVGGAHYTLPILDKTITIVPDWDLNGTAASVWLTHTGFAMPFAIFLLHNYISGLPRDVFEAARIDGADHFTIFWRLVLPLSVPVLAAFAIFQFLWTWNDFLIANTMVGTNPDAIPTTILIANLAGDFGRNEHVLPAAAFVQAFVPLVVFFALQRYFVRGILAGSVKG